MALLYEVGLNVLLRTSLVSSLAERSHGAIHIAYTRAYSALPGRIHVEGLRLRGEDSHLQWLVSVDEADFGWSPWAVLRRRFRAEDIDASGLVVRVRLKQSAPDAEHDSHVPPIAGYADPALKPIGPEALVTDANYRLVSIELERVRARHVREVWVDTLRVAGDATVTGRWLFRPLRELAIGPASVDVAAMSVARGPDPPLLQTIHGHVDVTLEPVDVRHFTERDTLRRLSTRLVLTGTLDAHRLAIASLSPFALQGAGFVAIQAALEKGVVQPESNAVVRWADLGVRRGTFEGDAHALLVAHAELDGLGVDATLYDLLVRREGEALARAPRMAASFRSSGRDLVTVPTDGPFEASVDGATVDDPSRWTPVLGWHVGGSALHAGATLSGRWGAPKAAATVTLSSDRLTVARGAVSAEADVHAHVTASLEGGIARGAMDLVATRAKVAIGDAELSAPVHATCEDATVDWRGEGVSLEATGLRVDASGIRLTLAGESAATVADAAASSSSLERKHGHWRGQVRGTVSDASIPDIGVANSFLAGRDLRLLRGAVRADAHADLDVASGTVEGLAHARGQGVTVQSQGLVAAGDIDATMHGVRAELATETELGGSRVVLSNVSVLGDRGWWARADVSDGAIGRRAGGWAGRLRLGVRARDARPLDALVSSRTPLPKWALGIFAMPNLTASGEIDFGPGRLAVRSAQADGGSTRVRAEMARSGGALRGIVLAEHGPLGVGIGVGKEEPGLVLINPTKWFVEEKEAMTRSSLALQGNPAELLQSR